MHYFGRQLAITSLLPLKQQLNSRHNRRESQVFLGSQLERCQHHAQIFSLLKGHRQHQLQGIQQKLGESGNFIGQRHITEVSESNS